VTRRTAWEIGAGLEPARPARPIPPGARIHVVGAGGAAGAARHSMPITPAPPFSAATPGAVAVHAALAEAGIAVAWQHAAAHVTDGSVALVDRLAVTKALTAGAPDHPELAAARALGVPATSVQQLIADAAATRGQELLGIAGTHGKSTTTGWVVHLLAASGFDPSAFVGALLPPSTGGGALASTARVGHGRHFVVEADEYAGNFDPYRPAIGAITNADWDHPDVFADRAEVVAVLAAWVRRFDGGGAVPTLVANAGDEGVREVIAALDGWPGRLVAVAVVDEADDVAAAGERLIAGLPWRGEPPRVVIGRWGTGPTGESSLEIRGLDRDPAATVVASIRLAGRHNAENGLVAAGVALVAGADPASIVAGLRSFAAWAAPGAEGRGRRVPSSTTTGITPPRWPPPSPPSPSAIRGGGCGPSTSR